MKHRNFGLDILRAAAILFVLFNHVMNYFITFTNSTVLGNVIGILGVEIFFVLSGFLIGRILLTEFTVDMKPYTIKRFYIRRWFRTLPLYYLLLIIFIALSIYSTGIWDVRPLHFFFLQNLSFKALNFFGVSWSLAIEEWFYLTLPLILYFSYKFKLLKSRNVYFLSALVLIIIALRLAFVLAFPRTFELMHKNIFFRFDSLLIGVIMAGLKLYDHPLYRQFQKPTRFLIALLITIVLSYSYIIFWERGALDASVFAKVFAFPLLSVSLGAILLFFETNFHINTIASKIRGFRWFITWTSLLSYSMYLIHLTVFDGVKYFLNEKISLVAMAPIALFFSFVFSYLLYRYIEQPFMRMRDRFKEKKH